MQSGSELPEYVAPLLRNGGSQSPDRWLKEHRNNHDVEADDWMDDMIQMFEKIKRPEHRELAKKQIALLAEIGDH